MRVDLSQVVLLSLNTATNLGAKSVSVRGEGFSLKRLLCREMSIFHEGSIEGRRRKTGQCKGKERQKCIWCLSRKYKRDIGPSHS